MATFQGKRHGRKAKHAVCVRSLTVRPLGVCVCVCDVGGGGRGWFGVEVGRLVCVVVFCRLVSHDPVRSMAYDPHFFLDKPMPDSVSCIEG